MDIQNIIKYIENLNNDYNELKKKIIIIQNNNDELTNKNIELQNEINIIKIENVELKDNFSNLSKVSIINSINNQLEEQKILNNILEKKLIKANNIINEKKTGIKNIQYKKNNYLLDTKTNKIYDYQNIHVANLINEKFKFL